MDIQTNAHTHKHIHNLLTLLLADELMSLVSYQLHSLAIDGRSIILRENRHIGEDRR